jgi:para-aminobenzoate synthetase component 1
VEELIPAPDPVQAWHALLGLPGLIWLDSAADQATLGRHSFLTADPWGVVRSTDRLTEQSLHGGPYETADGDALAVVRRLLAPLALPAVAGLPPFQGGAAGYIGYDWGRVLERLPSPRYDDLDVPDVLLGLYDWTLAWDHAAGRAWLISTGTGGGNAPSAARALERLSQIKNRLRATSRLESAIPAPVRRPAASPPTYPVAGSDAARRLGIRSTFSRPEYLAAVARVREYILAGDIFQANLSQRFEARLNDSDSAPRLYGRLRKVNPAPFAAYLDLEGVQVLSASPERFLRVDGASGMVETRPIKGTRPRGTGPMHDLALGQALTESEKDRAENLMIVDLLRNDLSRVCRAGTVRAPELFALEHHPTVHHLVSTVVGELDSGKDAIDLLHAAFPGGSITGAPKVRAMEIIAELEPTRRGVYCGSIGYLGLDGGLDTSIVIRTYLIRGGTVFFQAGGGIVADSEPAEEYQETLDKARGLMDALE